MTDGNQEIGAPEPKTTIDNLQFRHPNAELGKTNPELAARLDREQAWGDMFLNDIHRITNGEDPNRIIATWTEHIVNIEDGQYQAKQGRDAAQEELRTDDKTELGNQKAFIEELSGTKQGGLLYLDLNKFKLLNDKYGHDIGDIAIEKVGVALRGAIRQISKDGLARITDKAFRLHGDEHAVLLEGIHDPKILKQIADRIQQMIGQVFVEAGGKNNFLSASVGGLVFNSDRGMVGVIRNADQAMYFSKTVLGGTQTCILGVDVTDEQDMIRRTANANSDSSTNPVSDTQAT